MEWEGKGDMRERRSSEETGERMKRRKEAKCTDKKENKIFLINKEIQEGSVAKSYMSNNLLNFC